jgi:transposase-like protein
MNRTQVVRDNLFNPDEWQKLYYRNQQQYIRQRLTAINLLQKGQSRTQVSEQLNCRYDTLTTWIDKYIEGGLQGLYGETSYRRSPIDSILSSEGESDDCACAGT